MNLYNEDCLSGMRKIDDESIDLVVTSPPYDDLRKYNGYSFDFNGIAKELYRVIKKGGVLVWIVSDGTKNGSETGTSFGQALYFKKIGFNIHDTMIWQKTNPMPKVKTKRYFDVFEYMFVFSKGQPKTFNPITVECKFGGKVYSSTCKNLGGENGRTKKEFVLNKTRYANNIWQIAVAQNKTGHPAVFPRKIAHDHIISWSNKGDTVLDPFSGSGTTAIEAINNGRKFIGFEISKEYYDKSLQRINDETAQMSIFSV